VTTATIRTDTPDGYTLRAYEAGAERPYLVERHWRDEVAEHHEVTLLDSRGVPLSTVASSWAVGS
jgi:hypothetical protein